MKKNLTFFLFLLLSASAFSQDNGTVLKKDIISADIGLLSFWLKYERHLDGLFTLKSELGLGFGFEKGTNIDGTNYFFTPIVSVEPRYYYNFNRRVERGKKTSYNASNYFAFTASYFFKPYVIINVPYVEYQSRASLIPKWGIKRNTDSKCKFKI